MGFIRRFIRRRNRRRYDYGYGGTAIAGNRNSSLSNPPVSALARRGRFLNMKRLSSRYPRTLKGLKYVGKATGGLLTAALALYLMQQYAVISPFVYNRVRSIGTRYGFKSLPFTNAVVRLMDKSDRFLTRQFLKLAPKPFLHPSTASMFENNLFYDADAYSPEYPPVWPATL